MSTIHNAQSQCGSNAVRVRVRVRVRIFFLRILPPLLDSTLPLSFNQSLALANVPVTSTVLKSQGLGCGWGQGTIVRAMARASICVNTGHWSASSGAARAGVRAMVTVRLGIMLW